jgi:RNA polymerase sigma-70 factor (ECF subfamily)
LIGEDPDLALLRRVAKEDPVAVRQLVSAKLPRVLALAARMLGDRAEAEDVSQEVFERAWRQAAKWQAGRALFNTWLHMVTVNLCRDRLRRRRELTVDALPDQADPAPRPDEALGERERAMSVEAAVRQLPDRQREAIILVHYQDMSNIEAAKVLEVSVEALESLLARGRRNLRQSFGLGAKNNE